MDRYVAPNYALGDGKVHTVSEVKTLFDMKEIAEIDNMGCGITILEVPDVKENDIPSIVEKLKLLRSGSAIISRLQPR